MRLTPVRRFGFNSVKRPVMPIDCCHLGSPFRSGQTRQADAAAMSPCTLSKEGEQNDDRQRNSQHPKKYAAAHGLSSCLSSLNQRQAGVFPAHRSRLELFGPVVCSSAVTYVAVHWECLMNGVIYIVGLIVVVLAILSFLGLR